MLLQMKVVSYTYRIEVPIIGMTEFDSEKEYFSSSVEKLSIECNEIKFKFENDIEYPVNVSLKKNHSSPVRIAIIFESTFPKEFMSDNSSAFNDTYIRCIFYGR